MLVFPSILNKTIYKILINERYGSWSDQDHQCGSIASEVKKTHWLLLRHRLLGVRHRPGNHLHLRLQPRYRLSHAVVLDKLTYPTDNSGALCGYTYPNYPYVYYTSLTDPVPLDLFRLKDCASINALWLDRPRLAANRRLLLAAQPTTTPNFRWSFTTVSWVKVRINISLGRIGLFCLPTDPTLRQQILTMSNTAYKYDIFRVITEI